MKNLKIKFGLFSLLTILTVSIFLTSCEQETIKTSELPDTMDQQLEVVTSDVLSENDVRVTELKTIVSNEVADMGTPHFDMVTFVEYNEPGATALILPFINQGEMRMSWLISYFTDGEYKNSMFMEFTPTEEYAQEVVNDRSIDYSGEFAVYTKSGETVMKNVLKEGMVIETYENTELRGCLDSCIWWYINRLPWYKEWGCKAALAPCIGGLIASGLLVAGIITSPAAVVTGSIAAVGCTAVVACIGAGFYNCVGWC